MSILVIRERSLQKHRFLIIEVLYMVTLLKFGTVGVFNTLITFICYSILIYFGLNYLLSNIIGYSLGVLNSFYWNKNWVFKVSNNQSKRFLKFIIVNLITLGCNTFLLFLFVEYIHLNELIANGLAICVGLVINFILNKIWTFK